MHFVAKKANNTSTVSQIQVYIKKQFYSNMAGAKWGTWMV